ncbi:MAG: tail fiber protein [Candidatus Kapabacteria bacterium]|nr:tail fiber protein [Candidatus Kapabacteria bacterium]
MKIQYIFSLIVGVVLCCSSQFVHAENFEYKTTLIKQVVKTIPAKTIAGCNGGADVTIPAQDYTAVEIMATPADFTVVSFRVYNSDDLSTVKYSFMNRTPAQVNFNSTSGEIAFTMTGISPTRKELTVRVYLNDGSGPVYETQKFFTSQAKTGPPIGAIMPFYGSAAAAAALELGGWYLCDGRAISSIPDSVVYPSEKTDLIAVVGNNLPDLRGLFLRGIDPAGGPNQYDPDADRAVGSVQASQIQGHTHNYDRANSTTGSSSVTINRGGEVVQSGTGAVVGDDGFLTDGSHSHSISHTVTATSSGGSGGNDTRPVNAAVNYLIKVRH